VYKSRYHRGLKLLQSKKSTTIDVTARLFSTLTHLHQYHLDECWHGLESEQWIKFLIPRALKNTRGKRFDWKSKCFRLFLARDVFHSFLNLARYIFSNLR